MVMGAVYTHDKYCVPRVVKKIGCREGQLLSFESLVYFDKLRAGIRQAHRNLIP